MNPPPVADELDRAVAEFDRRPRRFGALCVALGLLGAYMLSAWGVPRLEATFTQRPDPPRPFTLTCGPYCEVDVAPVGGHQLRATCVCPGER